jgi:hypothetical protein
MVNVQVNFNRFTFEVSIILCLRIRLGLSLCFPTKDRANILKTTLTLEST